MKCPNCSAENRFNAISCEVCNASLLDVSDDPLDLNQFTTPAHSDPLVSPERSIPDVSDPEDDRQATEDNGDSFAVNAGEIWEKIRTFFVAAGSSIWAFLKKVFAWLGKWFSAAYRWLAQKLSRSDDSPERTPERNTGSDNNDDDEAGENFRKTILAIALGVLAIILAITFSVCGACSSCSCSSCGGDSLTGTWVEATSASNGYNPSDIILEFTGDGTVVSNGAASGSYGFADGTLTVSYGIMEYTCQTTADAEYIDLYLSGSDYAGMRLLKLSDETGLASDEIAELYPDE